MVSATGWDAAANQLWKEEYFYDVVGRIATTKVTQGTSPAVVKHSVYDGVDLAQLLMELDGSQRVTKTVLQGAAVDMIMGEESITYDGSGNPTAAWNWLLSDHQGTPVVSKPAGSGTSVNPMPIRTAFGEEISGTGSGSSTNFGFQGHEESSPTGLTNFRARMMQTDAGRFISQDPIRFASGQTNFYQFVGNHPHMATDPSGMEEERTWGEFLYDWTIGWGLPTSQEIKDTTNSAIILSNHDKNVEQTRKNAGNAVFSQLDPEFGKLQQQPSPSAGVISRQMDGLSQAEAGLKAPVEGLIKFSASMAGGAFFKPSGVSPRTSHRYLGAKQLEGKVQDKAIDKISAGDVYVSTSKASMKTIPREDIWQYYTNPGQHVKNSRTYVQGKELLPANHEQLFEQSVPIYDKDNGEWERWAREGNGKDARYHRFSQHSENEFHWTGSSHGGVDSQNRPRKLSGAIPKKEIDKAIDPPKKSGWWMW